MRQRKRMLEQLDVDIREHIERETQDNIESAACHPEERATPLTVSSAT
jgi:hypothetical protein